MCCAAQGVAVQKAWAPSMWRTHHIAAIACSQLLGIAYAHQLPIHKDSQPVTQYLHHTASLQRYDQLSAILCISMLL